MQRESRTIEKVFESLKLLPSLSKLMKIKWATARLVMLSILLSLKTLSSSSPNCWIEIQSILLFSLAQHMILYRLNAHAYRGCHLSAFGELEMPNKLMNTLGKRSFYAIRRKGICIFGILYAHFHSTVGSANPFLASRHLGTRQHSAFCLCRPWHEAHSVVTGCSATRKIIMFKQIFIRILLLL